MIRAAIALALALAACGGAAASGPPLLMSLPALDGGDLVLTAYRGKVVVLHLFLTWDIGAQVDIPQLNAAAARDDVVVIGVALDPEGYVLVAPWRSGSDVTYQVALASADIREGRSALGPIDVVPTTVVLDRRGRITARVPRALAAGELAKLVERAGS